MKRGFLGLITIVFIVLAAVVIVDVAVGRVMDWMLPQISNQGDTGKTYFSFYEVDSPIVIVGSSRAAHHFDPYLVEEELGEPTYNVGRDHCFFSYNCCVINSILERYSPHIIIWENSTSYLYSEFSDPLERLYPYCGKNPWVTQTLDEELPWSERVRLASSLYRYNSLFHRVLLRYVGRKKFVDTSRRGYTPIQALPQPFPLTLDTIPVEYEGLSQTKIARFRSTLAKARERNVRMIVVSSPKYVFEIGDNLSRRVMEEICKEQGALFIDDSQMPYFYSHPEFFHDTVHLNEEGAACYTRMFLKQMEQLLP